MAIRVRPTSRLNFARLVTLGTSNIECWEMPEYPVINEGQDDVIYQVQQEDRIDLLAERFYGNPELWWVIAIVNGMALLPNDLRPSSTIRIPSNNRVYNIILKLAPRRREGR